MDILEDEFLDILKGTATQEERNQFFSGLQDDAEEKEAFMHYEKIWVVNNMARLQVPASEKRLQFKKFWSNTGAAIRFSTPQFAAGIAAAFVIAFFLAQWLIPSLNTEDYHTIEVNTPKGNISNITLEDGSRIWFNSSSKADIATYDDEKYEVTLTGEAFFDIPHNDKREFIVHVGDYKIRDMGTRFNVNYKKESGEISAALFEGAIDFSRHKKSVFKDLKPGHKFVFDGNSGNVKVYKADYDFITAWKNGKFVFVDRTLEEIARELEDWYDVEFEFKDTSVKSEVFSGVIKRKTSIEHLLKVLKLSAKMDYNIEEQKNGSLKVVFE